MSVTWTTTQRQRLNELNAEEALMNQEFANPEEREQAFLRLDRELVARHKKELADLKNGARRPLLTQLETQLAERLTREGFVQVVTPILLSRSMLNKMTITSGHPLLKQVFWVDKDKCLRPMLAPNLYHLLIDLRRLWGKPVRIFEIGPCFRKESQGAQHLNEFTMLNLVELGDLEGQQGARLRQLADIVMEAAGIKDYRLEKEESNVYETTIDVACGDLEMGSGAYGPHKLDALWGVTDPWVGIGFGLERLVMAIKGHRNIRRAGRSLSYLDGVRLNI